MRGWTRLLFVLNMAISLAYQPAWGAPPSSLRVDEPVLNLQESFAKVAARLKPAVVNITAVHVESYQGQPYEFYFGHPFFDGPSGPGDRGAPRQRRSHGIGSGVIVDPNGLILTNDHVVRDATEIEVRLSEPDEKTYKGLVVGRDPRSDLAVIKVEPEAPLASAVLGDSDKIRVGDWAIAVGSPFGLEQTVTVGVISAVRQSLEVQGQSYDDFLQTDAAINQGNSGGPLVNIHGEVIGINTAIYAPTGVFAGIGFAIPSSRAKNIMDQLIEKGRVVRGWMGVEIAPLNEILAQQFGVPDEKGVVVNRVLPDSPAERAGLVRGDVIRRFKGNKIDSAESLQRVVAQTTPNTEVDLQVIRNGKKKDLALVTGEMPSFETGLPERKQIKPAPSRREPVDAEWEGARVMTVTPSLADRFALPVESAGVVVAVVEPGSRAEEMGLVQGDLVSSINRQRTPTLKAFLRAVEKVKLRKGVLLDVNRRGRWIYLSYRQDR